MKSIKITSAFFFLLLFSTTCVLAQKIKVKKNVVYLDKVEVGSIKKKTVDMDARLKQPNDKASSVEAYVFEDLKGKQLVVRDFKAEPDLPFYLAVNSWKIMMTNFNKDSYEFDMGAFSFNAQKAYIKEFVAKGWLNSNGVNISKVNEVMSQKKDETFYQRFLNAKKVKEEEIKKEAEQKALLAAQEEAKKKKAYEVDSVINPFVNRDGTVVRGGHKGTEKIGMVKAPNNYGASLYSNAKFYDLQGNLIAKAVGLGDNGLSFTTFDGKKFEFKSDKYKYNELLYPLFMGQAVAALMKEGYFYNATIPYDKTKDTLSKKK